VLQVMVESPGKDVLKVFFLRTVSELYGQRLYIKYFIIIIQKVFQK
jgi:hypothetical protein